MNRDCTTSPDNLHQCLTILTVKKYFHLLDNSLCFSLCPLSLVRSQGTPNKVSCWLAHFYIQPRAFFFSRLNYTGSFSLLSWGMLQALNSFCGPYSMSMPLLLRYPALDKALQVCFPNTSQRTRITCWQCFVLPSQDIAGSLYLEGALLPDSQLVHQVIHSLLLENCFPDGWPLACTRELGYFSPGAGVFLFAELHEIPLCLFLQPLPVLQNGRINIFYQPRPSRILNSPKFVFKALLLSSSFLSEPQTPPSHGHYSQGDQGSRRYCNPDLHISTCLFFFLSMRSNISPLSN